MNKISFTNWLLNIIHRHRVIVRFVFKMLVIILSILYLVYFAKFGYDFSQTNTSHPLQTVVKGLLLPALAVIIFFIMHFSGGVDFDLKLIGLPIGFAAGGTIVGLVGGLMQGVTGWLLGTLIGTVVIFFVMRLSVKQKS